MAAKEKVRKRENATGAVRRIEGIMARREVKVERGAHTARAQGLHGTVCSLSSCPRRTERAHSQV